jgi:hypothetical protein
VNSLILRSTIGLRLFNSTLSLALGFVGDEFKTARLHLTKRLGGSAAWRGERRDRRPRPATAPAGGDSEAGPGVAREAA